MTDRFVLRNRPGHIQPDHGVSGVSVVHFFTLPVSYCGPIDVDGRRCFAATLNVRRSHSCWQRESGSELENFAYLRGAVDASGISRHPGCVHRPRGDVIKALRSDADCAEIAGHVQRPDEDIENVASFLTRSAHRRRYQILSRRIGWPVPAHYRREHDAGGVAVRDPEERTKHVADPVTRAHRYAGG